MERWGDQGGERWKESKGGGSAVGGSTGAEDHCQRRKPSETGKGLCFAFLCIYTFWLRSIHSCVDLKAL